MKHLAFLLFLISFTSCVSSKKYKSLYSDHESLNSELRVAHANLANVSNKLYDLEKEKIKLSSKLEASQVQVLYKEDNIRILNDNEQNLKKTNRELKSWVDNFTSNNAVLVENNKKAISELERQNQRVEDLNKSIAKKSAVNVLIVKKAKRNITDKKLLRSLEKLGIII